MPLRFTEIDTIVHISKSPQATEAIARGLASALTMRDTICLEGTLGAGKSVFARALIRCLIGDDGFPVPSPSYTLANVYSTPQGHEIWHADLYRISDPEEIAEIGLDDAAGDALLIVEWAGKWGDCPPSAMHVAISVEDTDTRRIEISGPAPAPERAF